MDNINKTITYILISVAVLFLIGFLLKSSLYIAAIVLVIYLVRKTYVAIKLWIEKKNNNIKKKRFRKELEEMKENRNSLTFMEAEIVKEPVKFQRGNEEETFNTVVDVDYKDIDK